MYAPQVFHGTRGDVSVPESSRDHCLKIVDVLKDALGNSMKTGSLCGHGQLGYSPIASAIKIGRAHV